MAASPTQLTVRCRVMRPHLDAPHKFRGETDEKLKYKVSLVIHKDDPVLQQLRAIEQSLIANDLEGHIPTGNDVLLKEDPNNANLAGCYYINAKTKQQPRVVDKDRKPLVGGIDDGDYCYVAINVYAYTQPNKGIAAFLNGVMFDQKGQGRIASSGAPSDDDMWSVVPTADGPPTI